MRQSKRGRWLGSLAVAAGVAVAGAVRADENLTGYIRGAETLPVGTSESYLWVTHHGDKRSGEYEADYLRLEYEYGVSDRLSASIAVNGYRHDYRDPVPGEIEGSMDDTQLSGISIELKRMLLSPYKDDLGVALYGELTYDSIDSITGEEVDAFEIETKLILHKVYLDGELHWMNNLELEVETSDPDAGGPGESAIAPRLRSGLSYRFRPNWFAGVEGWVDAELLKPEGAAWEFDHWDFFAGPNLHYGGQRWWTTVAYVTQVAGSDERDAGNTDQHLADHEKFEVRVKIGYNF